VTYFTDSLHYKDWSLSSFDSRRSIEKETDRYKILTTTSEVLSIFVTLESFGINSTYTDYDGIPRLAFLATPTHTVTRRVDILSISLWNYASFRHLPPLTSALAQNTTLIGESEKGTTLQEPPTPSCTLAERQCQEIYAH
jgi:hypothetical protein